MSSVADSRTPVRETCLIRLSPLEKLKNPAANSAGIASQETCPRRPRVARPNGRGIRPQETRDAATRVSLTRRLYMEGCKAFSAGCVLNERDVVVFADSLEH